jgi:uncharacterized protein YciI
LVAAPDCPNDHVTIEKKEHLLAASALKGSDKTHEILYVVMSKLVGDDPGVITAKLADHRAFGAELRSRGVFVDGGPLLTPGGENSGNGIYILRAESLAEATEIANQDPMHISGIRIPTVSPWLRKKD